MRLVTSATLLIPSASACGSCQTTGPASFAEQPAWLESLKQDRANTQEKIGWKGGVSDQIPWTLTSYMQPQVHPYDRYLYDPVKKVYTVDRYLEDLKTRYGGIDSVLIWPTYPLSGLDDRSQYDIFAALPGGLPGLRDMVSDFHAHGVRVLEP